MSSSRERDDPRVRLQAEEAKNCFGCRYQKRTAFELMAKMSAPSKLRDIAFWRAISALR